MSVNKDRPHLYIIPEDDDDRQLAEGFINNLQLRFGQARALPPAGGWRSVLDKFKSTYIRHLRDYAGGHLVMLIDFDEQVEARTAMFAGEIPDDIKDRVFVVGVLDEPKDLRRSLNRGMSYEEIGSTLADECFADAAELWAHPHLKHNDRERVRLRAAVKDILFPDAPSR